MKRIMAAAVLCAAALMLFTCVADASQATRGYKYKEIPAHLITNYGAVTGSTDSVWFYVPNGAATDTFNVIGLPDDFTHPAKQDSMPEFYIRIESEENFTAATDTIYGLIQPTIDGQTFTAVNWNLDPLYRVHFVAGKGSAREYRLAATEGPSTNWVNVAGTRATRGARILLKHIGTECGGKMRVWLGYITNGK